MKTLNIKALSLGVAAAVITSGAAIAGAPTAFDAWTSNPAGDITFTGVGPNGCPQDFTCTTVATDNGFVQRQLVDANGVTYIQSVLLDATNGVFAANSAASNFSDESFIKMTTPGAGGNGNTQGGLANKSKVGDVGFSQNSELVIGSFFTAGDDNFKVDQVVSGADGAGTASTDFFTAFNFSQIKTAMGGNTDSSALKLASVTHDIATGEKQAFNFSRSNDITGLATTFDGQNLNIGGLLLDGTTVASNNAVSFETIWVGQDFGGQAFGVQEVRNKDAADAVTQLAKKNSFSATGFETVGTPTSGFDWNTALGAGVYAPSF